MIILQGKSFVLTAEEAFDKQNHKVLDVQIKTGIAYEIELG